jgi:hypothetical protein
MFLKYCLDYLLKLLRIVIGKRKLDLATSRMLAIFVVVAAVLEVFLLTAFIVMLIVSRVHLGL